MRALILLLSAITVTTQTATIHSQTAANTPTVLELDGTSQSPVLLGSREVIRAADDPLPEGSSPLQPVTQRPDRIYNGMLSVELSVVLNGNGRVESAKPISGPQRFYEQAVEIEQHRAFAPVRDTNGTIVRAHFTDSVSIDPPEQWLEHPPTFPELVDLPTFRISLQRTGCFGTCPDYKVTIDGAGNVLWKGAQNTAAPGTRRAKISQAAVQQLVDHVRSSHVFSALDKYESDWTDNPTYTLTVDVNGLHKQVVDYIGNIVGMPTSISELEDTVDRIAGTDKWVKGETATLK